MSDEPIDTRDIEHEDPQDIPMDMDTLFTKHVDAAQADKDLNQNLGQRGTYEVDPDLGDLQTFPATPREEDPQRRTFRLVGRLRGQFRSGEEVAVIRLSVFISPDARTKRDYDTGEEIEGKHDSPYVRWLESVRAYQDTYREVPKDEQAVIAFLKSGRARFVLAPIAGKLRVTRIVGRQGGQR